MFQRGGLNFCFHHKHEDKDAIVVPLQKVLMQRKTIHFYNFCLLFEAYVTVLNKKKLIEEETLYNFTTYYLDDGRVKAELHSFIVKTPTVVLWKKLFPTSINCLTRHFEYSMWKAKIEEKNDSEDDK